VKDEIRATWVDLLRRLAPLVPADLFAQLRLFSSLTVLSAEEERALADYLQRAIAALDSLHHTLTSFLPRYLLDLSPTPGQPHGELLEGSFIFADVTGFTALTGELSRQGTAGREEMNRLMRALFAALLEPLLNSGGDLLIFAGDAVLASFPARPEGQDARWATRTALRLVEAIAPFAQLETPYGTFSLTMSAGVERGVAFAAVAGSPQRMEFLISGGPVQGAMQAEAMVDPGQVFVGQGVLPFLCPDEFNLQGSVVEGIRGGELSDYEPPPPARRRRHISAIFSRRLPDLLGYLEAALKQVEDLVPFIPPDLFVQIARGEDVRQHPPVAVQFVNVLGLEEIALGSEEPEKAAAVFQRYFVQAQEAVASRGGINQIDPYAKGFTLLNSFGALSHHEGVTRLAASAALDLVQVLAGVNREFDLDPPLTQRIGMTYERIFTGEIGYRHRREYVVAGPAVNLAARLMSKAEPGQVVLDPVAWEAVRGDFVADELEPIPLKGIAEPVSRFLLRRVRKGKEARVIDYPIVGCRREQAVLNVLLDEATAGRGGAVALVGQAGYGKNLLAEHVADRAASQGMAVLMGRCLPFAQSTPYVPWKGMVDVWLGLDEDLPYEERRKQLRERLTEFDMTQSLPAFIDLLGLADSHLPSRPASVAAEQDRDIFSGLQERMERVTSEQGEDGRDWRVSLAERAARVERFPRSKGKGPSIWDVVRERASISYALYLLLERVALRQPTLVVIEDIHWMDPDSWQVLDWVTKAACASSLLVLVTSRPGSGWSGDCITMMSLSDDDSQALASLALQADRLEPDLVDWLLDRAKGNPLFILSYCRALRDAEAVAVDPATGEARWSGPPPPLPLSLQELLLAQVERLGKEARQVLERASVVGTTFPVWLLSHLCEDVLPVGRLSGALEEAARSSLITPPPFAQAHTFSSQSLCEAIYATLSHATRRDLHERTGDRLAQTDESTFHERLEQIAYHYSRSGDAYKAAHSARLAGDKARACQADGAAVAFYERALSETGDADVAGEQRLAHEGLGDVRALQGEGEAAVKAYQAALLSALPEDTPRLEAKLALLSPMLDQPDPELLEQALRQLPGSASLRSWLEAALCWAYAERGEVKAAAAVCQGLPSGAGGSAGGFLQEMLGGLDRGETLISYSAFFALFAPSYLRFLVENE
jgi:class 3 adenylate cyclase